MPANSLDVYLGKSQRSNYVAPKTNQNEEEEGGGGGGGNFLDRALRTPEWRNNGKINAPGLTPEWKRRQGLNIMDLIGLQSQAKGMPSFQNQPNPTEQPLPSFQNQPNEPTSLSDINTMQFGTGMSTIPFLKDANTLELQKKWIESTMVGLTPGTPAWQQKSDALKKLTLDASSAGGFQYGAQGQMPETTQSPLQGSGSNPRAVFNNTESGTTAGLPSFQEQPTVVPTTNQPQPAPTGKLDWLMQQGQGGTTPTRQPTAQEKAMADAFGIDPNKVVAYFDAMNGGNTPQQGLISANKLNEIAWQPDPADPYKRPQGLRLDQILGAFPNSNAYETGWDYSKGTMNDNGAVTTLADGTKLPQIAGYYISNGKYYPIDLQKTASFIRWYRGGEGGGGGGGWDGYNRAQQWNTGLANWNIGIG